MTRYVFRRLGAIAITLGLISMIVFAAIHVLPGSAATLILGEYATPEALATLEREMGLDRPLVVQYLGWIGSVVRGDWGTSLAMKQPVAGIVALRLQHSAALALGAFALVVLIAIPLGTIAALARGRLLDLAILAGTYVGISVPEFVTGLALLLVLAGPSLGWLPTSGYAELSAGLGELGPAPGPARPRPSRSSWPRTWSGRRAPGWPGCSPPPTFARLGSRAPPRGGWWCAMRSGTASCRRSRCWRSTSAT